MCGCCCSAVCILQSRCKVIHLHYFEGNFKIVSSIIVDIICSGTNGCRPDKNVIWLFWSDYDHRMKIKTLSHTPSPAPFFQHLFQQHDGNLQVIWCPFCPFSVLLSCFGKLSQLCCSAVLMTTLTATCCRYEVSSRSLLSTTIILHSSAEADGSL